MYWRDALLYRNDICQKVIPREKWGCRLPNMVLYQLLLEKSWRLRTLRTLSGRGKRAHGSLPEAGAASLLNNPKAPLKRRRR